VGLALGVAEATVVAGQETRVQVELEIDAVELDEVTVDLTRTGRRVQDEPLRVEVIGEEEIAEKMLMTPGNIVMLLNETGGLRVQVTSPSLGAANVRIQGMRGRYTQILADGLPLYGGQAGSIGLMQIPPVDLGQVEVVKGVASALYGGSALGGVINLVSRRPAESHGGELLLNASTLDGQDATAHLSGPLTPDWGYALTGGLHRQGIRDLDDSGWADVPGHRRVTLRPRLFWSGAGGGSALLTLGGMLEDREGGTLPGRTLPAGGTHVETLDTRRFDAGVSARHPVGDSHFLRVRGSAMLQRHRHGFGAREERDRHGTLLAEASLSGGDARLSWVAGGALQQDRYRSDDFPDFDYTFTVPAVFGQGEVRLSPAVSASLSARWDHHSRYGDQWSPRVSVLYRPGAWTVRGSVGGGFFAPTPFVEEIEAVGLARLAVPEGLRAERARTASVDAGRLFGPWEVSATLFASRVEHTVQLVPLDPGDAEAPAGVELRNAAGPTETAGTELLLRYRRDHFALTGSYVFVRATESDPAAPGTTRDLPLTPRHTAGLVAMWEDHDRGMLGIEAYYTGRQPLDNNPWRDEGRAHLHLGVLGELRREGWSVFLNAENLLNVRQTRHDPLVRDVRAPDGSWTVDAWAPLEGVSLNGGVRFFPGG
jgi:outer membrane receptor for ferrienterochelin and colicins